MPTYEDSHLRCPKDGKRMMVELGPDDEGRLVALHECWECNYTIRAQREIGPDVVKVIGAVRAARAQAGETLIFDGTSFRPADGGAA